MKSIAVVTNGKSSLASIYKKKFKIIFNGFVKINNYYIDHLESTKS